MSPLPTVSGLSSASCFTPAGVFDVPASTRLLRAWLLWMACLALAILLGTDLPWWVRILAAVGLWPLWWLGRRTLRVGGRLALREDGQWLWQPGGGAIRYVRPAGAPQHLGRWWWLPWRHGRVTEWVLIDAAVMEPAAFSALQCSLRLKNRSTGAEFADASQAEC